MGRLIIIVTTVNNNGESAESSQTSATPQAPSATPVKIMNVSPGGGDTGISVNSAITATFSANMNSLTINSNSFILKQGDTIIPGTISYNSTTKTATFTPSSDLSNYQPTYGTTYDVTIKPTVKDMSGNHLDQEYRWSFTTATITAGGLTTLSLNTSASGTLSSDKDSKNFKVTVPAGKTLSIILDGNTKSGYDQNNLYVKFGSVPSTDVYDYKADSGGMPDQALSVPNTQAGDYYIMVYGAYWWGGGPNFFNISADYSPH